MRDVMIRFTAVLSANPAPASAKTRPRQKLRFGDLASEIASSMLTIVLFDNERGGRWEGREVPISCDIYELTTACDTVPRVSIVYQLTTVW